MRERVKLFVAACFYFGGLVKLLRWWTRQSGRRTIILNYHFASGGDLYSHLLYLRRHYRILPLETALKELSLPHKRGKQDDRRTPLVLTFDDGYHDNYTHAFAFARELQIPITIFLIPGYIQSGKCFWWLEGDHLVRHARVEEATLEGHTYYLKRKEERDVLAKTIYSRARYAASVAEREQYLARVREVLAVPESLLAEEAILPLKWAEVREMEASRWVSFGAHTMHHPVLAYLQDAAEVQCEISECRAVMERQLGHPVHIFAYPIGKPEHIGEEALRAVREVGYHWALTTIHGINTPQSEPHQLRRIETGVDRHWLVLAAEMVGVWQVFSPLRRNSVVSKRGRM